MYKGCRTHRPAFDVHGTAGSVNIDDQTTPATPDALTARLGFFPDSPQAPATHLGIAGAVADLQGQLADLEVRYRGIIDRLPAVIYIDGIGHDDLMVDVSPGIEDLLGVAREEWLHRQYAWIDVVHPDDRGWVVAASERATETGEPFRIEYRAIHRDGTVRWIKEDCVLIRDAAGTPMYWLGLMVDVSDDVETRGQLHEARTKYGALVEQIPAIVYVDVADEHMTTTYVSPQIESLLGYTAEQYVHDPSLWA